MDRPSMTALRRRRWLGAADDATLVALAASGSGEAWDELTRRFDTMLSAIAFRHGLCSSDGADVAQRTWTQFLRSIGRIREPGKVGGWLARTARRECYRILERRDVPVDPVTIDRRDPASPDGAQRLVDAEERAAVRAALRHIPPRGQELLQRLHWDEHSYKRISADMGMPVGSIGPTQMRLLASLARTPEMAMCDPKTI